MVMNPNSCSQLLRQAAVRFPMMLVPILILFVGFISHPFAKVLTSNALYDFGRRSPHALNEERAKIKGQHIRSIVTKQYAYDQHDSVKRIISDNIRMYDTAGNVITMIQHYPLPCDTLWFYRTFDKKGNIITQRRCSSNNGECYSDTFSYSINGLPTGVSNYNEENTLEYRRALQYDSHDNIVEEIIWKKDEIPQADTTKFRNEYDGNGALVKYFVNNILSTEWTYDANGNRISAIESTEVGRRLFTYEYSRTNKLMSTKCSEFRNDVLAYEYVDQYNDDDNLVESVSTDHQGRRTIIKNDFNTQKDVILTVIQDFIRDTLDTQRTYIYNRNYDGKGNLIYLEETDSIFTKDGTRSFTHLLKEYSYQYFQ